MGNEAVKKFTWVIKNFSSLDSKFIYSDQFIRGGCKWRLLAYPKGDEDRSCFPLYLVVSGYKTLPSGWRRNAKFSITIVNQIPNKLSERKEKQEWFDRTNPFSGFKSMIPLSRLYDKDGGFLVNDEVKVIVEIEVGKVSGNLDFSVKSPEVVVTKPLNKKIKLNHDDDCVADSKDLVKDISLVKESIDVNGFQVLPSQVEFVSCVFKKYPEIAIELRAKNESLRTAGMYVFLSLIKTLCKSMQELSNVDLMEAENALTYLKGLGIKLDWLEVKLEEVKEKKKQEEIGETRMQELEEELKGVKEKCSDIEALLEKKKEELKDFKQKWSDIEAQLEIQKAIVVVARAPVLTLDEVI